MSILVNLFNYKNNGGCLMNQFITTKRTLVAVILAIAMVFSATTIAAATTVEEYAHGELAYKHLEFIDENLPQRIPFSPRERETAEWLVYELIKMGHSPDNIYIQEFPKPEYMREMMTWWGDMFGENPELLDYSQNVILTVPGISDKTIIVGAHYDSVDNNGISDNASGTVVLLESAQRMLYLEHYYTIVYIFFGAEEVGLYGANYFVASLTEEEKENIVLMINIDVIFDGSVLFYAAGFHDVNTSEMGSNAATLLIDEIAQNLNEELDLGLVRQHNGIYIPSDQLPFVWAGFNVVVFHAVDGLEPMPPGNWLSFLEMVELIEAMVHGTDDPEVTQAIYENRENLEWMLWWWLDEDLSERIEHLEQLLNEEDSFMFADWVQEEIEATKRIMALLEHPNMETFEFQNEFTRWLSPLDELLLIEALIEGTDDPELIASIHQHSESLKWTLSWYTSMETEWLLADIERIQDQLRVEEDPWLIEWLQEDLERTKRIMTLLEHPKMQGLEFTMISVVGSLQLLEAMVHGTDDPELAASIYENREFLEWDLWWMLSDAETLPRRMENLERQIKEIDNPIIIGWLQENLETAKEMIAFLEHPKVEEFEFTYPKPLLFQERVLLIEAMVYGTHDPGVIETINEHREDLEHILWWWLSDVEHFSERIDAIEQQIREEEGPALTEWLLKELEEMKRIMAILEHPNIEKFEFIFPRPLSFLEEVLLIEAMVYGTDDPEIIASINERRESLEWTLAWHVSMRAEWLLWDIEHLEQLIKETEDPVSIEMWSERLEAVQKMVAVLESPQMEQFVFEYEFDFGNWWGLGFGYVLHTPNDNLTFINENWPGLIERALRSYSIFLENILTLPAQSLEVIN